MSSNISGTSCGQAPEMQAGYGDMDSKKSAAFSLTADFIWMVSLRHSIDIAAEMLHKPVAVTYQLLV